MKKKSLTLMVAALVLFSNVSTAQKFKGQSNFTAGTSLSLTGIFLNLVKEGININSDATAKSIPAINAMYDYGISDVFSIGGAFSYQSWSLEYKGYTNSNGDTVVGNFKDKISRMNFGIRPLFHFGNNDDLDTYAGARISFTQWAYTTNSGNTSSTSDIFGANPVKFQALFGMRYFFTENIGLNMEFAIGPTYYAMFGINFRFGGMGGGSSIGTGG